MRESKIESYLRTEIQKLGGTAEKFTSPGVRGKPDQLVAWGRAPGDYAGFPPPVRVEFIETKRPKNEGGRLSVLQKKDHERRRAMGFQVHVIWDMAGAETYLKSRGKR